MAVMEVKFGFCQQTDCVKNGVKKMPVTNAITVFPCNRTFLDVLDKQYGISDKVIAFIKEEIRRKPRTQETDLQYFLNTMGRIK
ncbi:hypothetical protein [Xenorhabdus griffiniae]|uniref:hypothetical protein n=1 Tax=Xenorhabdus griffiniae TaxID=351672 RepID=UPI002358A668|nr:hypothetical protein [Xenorhabdus griffiniae]MDC9605344.1 hypothetical protein [Xenorhabdus griffiniae]